MYSYTNICSKIVPSNDVGRAGYTIGRDVIYFNEEKHKNAFFKLYQMPLYIELLDKWNAKLTIKHIINGYYDKDTISQRINADFKCETRIGSTMGNLHLYLSDVSGQYHICISSTDRYIHIDFDGGTYCFGLHRHNQSHTYDVRNIRSIKPFIQYLLDMMTTPNVDAYREFIDAV